MEGPLTAVRCLRRDQQAEGLSRSKPAGGALQQGLCVPCRHAHDWTQHQQLTL